ncbi:MAG: PilZ domain-containing protein [Desulfobulbaceae bacterium]|nr:PilZ domain-containing protein [Desulfobulbaceae bacterium]
MGEAAVLADGRLAERISAVSFDGATSLVLEVRDLVFNVMAAQLLNISQTGMGVVTEHELSLGQMVSVTNGLNSEMPKKAVVMWSTSFDGGFRSGLKFVRAS